MLECSEINGGNDGEEEWSDEWRDPGRVEGRVEATLLVSCQDPGAADSRVSTGAWHETM